MSFCNPNSLHYIIDWSAWATLIVGIAAVVGAVVIGMRQASIADRQAQISERQAHIMERQTGIAGQQAETEQTRLRAELYDRRVVVYAGIERYLDVASSEDGIVPNEVRDGLFQSLSVARFILGDDVEIIGRDIHMVAANLRSNMRKLEKERDEGKRTVLFDAIEANNDRLVELHSQVRGTMERYLRLSH